MDLEGYFLIVERHFPKVDYELNETIISPYDEKFFEANQSLGIIYVSILALLSTVGIVGNIMVLGAIAVSPRLRTTGNIFIANLALADLGVTAIVHPMSIIGFIEGPNYFRDQILLCHMIAGLCLICCFSSTWNIAAIAANRYTFLVHNSVYDRIYTWRKCVMYCFMLWVSCCLADLSTYLGWGAHAYDMKIMACSYDRLSEYSFTLFIILFLLVFPLTVVAVSYVRIFVFVRNTKRNVRSFNEKGGQTKCTAVKRDEIQLAKTLFVIFIIFSICWLPYGTLTLFDTKNLAPRICYLLAIQSAHTNSTINSILYAATNKRFRQGFKMFLFICFKPVVNVHSTITNSVILSVQSTKKTFKK